MSILAVLKAGATYLPLRPRLSPPTRLAFMIEDSGAPAVITARRFRPLLTGEGPRVLELDCLAETLAHQSYRDPDVPLRPESPAYVIYTSGSTGRPKGVMIPHRAAAVRLGHDAAANLDAGSRFLSLSPISFDMSVTQTFSALAAGHSTALMPPERQRDVAFLADLLAREEVTHAGFPPVLLEALLDAEDLTGNRLRQVISGGETMPADLPEKFYRRLPHAELLNRYGPTEATVAVTSWTVPQTKGAAAPCPSVARSPEPTSTCSIQSCGRCRSVCPASW